MSDCDLTDIPTICTPTTGTQMAGTVKPRARDDLVLSRLYESDDRTYVLGSANIDRYLVTDKRQGRVFLRLLKTLNGNKTVEQLSEEWQIDPEAVKDFVSKMASHGFIENMPQYERMGEVQRLAKKVFSVNLTWLSKIPVGFIRAAIAVFWVLFLFSMALLVYFCGYEQRSISVTEIFAFHNSYVAGLLISMAILIPSSTFHELCHIVVALAHGLTVKKFECCLYFGIFPMLYVKINGLYCVRENVRRNVLLAGVIGNAFLAAVSLVGYWLTDNKLWMISIYSQVNMILGSINFLSLSDGYFVYTILARQHNLRSKMFKLIVNPHTVWRRASQGLKLYAIMNLVFMTISITYASRPLAGLLKGLLKVDIPAYGAAILLLPSLILYVAVVRRRYKNKDAPVGKDIIADADDVAGSTMKSPDTYRRDKS